MAVEAGNFYIKERGPFAVGDDETVTILANDLGYRPDGPFMHHTITFDAFEADTVITIEGLGPANAAGGLVWVNLGTVTIGGANEAFVIDPRTVGVFGGFRITSSVNGDDGDVYFRSTLVGI